MKPFYKDFAKGEENWSFYFELFIVVLKKNT